MNFLIITFNIALLIWIALTFKQGDNIEHWLQIGMIFGNCVSIGIQLEVISRRFTKGFTQ